MSKFSYDPDTGTLSVETEDKVTVTRGCDPKDNTILDTEKYRKQIKLDGNVTISVTRF
jgi:hypothetical protein